MKRWVYEVRCLSCSGEYRVYPETVKVGPVFESRLKGYTLTADPLEINHLIEEPVYTGSILRIRCPRCYLELLVATDLSQTELHTHFAEHRRNLDKDLYEAILTRIPDLAGFPIQCPRCDLTLEQDSPRWICKHCEDDQLQLVDTYRETT